MEALRLKLSSSSSMRPTKLYGGRGCTTLLLHARAAVLGRARLTVPFIAATNCRLTYVNSAYRKNAQSAEQLTNCLARGRWYRGRDGSALPTVAPWLPGFEGPVGSGIRKNQSRDAEAILTARANEPLNLTTALRVEVVSA